MDQEIFCFRHCCQYGWHTLVRWSKAFDDRMADFSPLNNDDEQQYLVRTERTGDHKSHITLVWGKGTQLIDIDLQHSNKSKTNVATKCLHFTAETGTKKIMPCVCTKETPKVKSTSFGLQIRSKPRRNSVKTEHKPDSLFKNACQFVLGLG